jgi:hypothetical protein
MCYRDPPVRRPPPQRREARQCAWLSTARAESGLAESDRPRLPRSLVGPFGRAETSANSLITHALIGVRPRLDQVVRRPPCPRGPSRAGPLGVSTAPPLRQREGGTVVHYSQPSTSRSGLASACIGSAASRFMPAAGSMAAKTARQRQGGCIQESSLCASPSLRSRRINLPGIVGLDLR